MDSEAASKKRGRPEVFSDVVLERIVSSGVAAARHVTTRRGAQDLAYRVRAVAVIENYRRIYPDNAEPLEWLFRSGDLRGETWRHSLLTELGRAGDPPVIVTMALRIAQLQPSTKDGVRLIRRWRQALTDLQKDRKAGEARVDNS